MTLDDLLARLMPLRARHGNSPVRMACGDVEDVLAVTAPKFRPEQLGSCAEKS